MHRKGNIAEALRSRASARPDPATYRAATMRTETAADREFKEWLALYEPMEKAIIDEREKRAASKHRRAIDRRKEFGALCEITEGRAAFARRNGMSLTEADRIFRRLRPFHPSLALPCMLLGDAWSVVRTMRTVLTKRIDRAKHEAVRPFYYAQERARRQMLAAERRKVRMRHTMNPCPTRERILKAWTKVKESPEALLRFGSLMEDLECYVDNGLRHTEDGVIVGRNPGIKGWLQTEIPALYLKYKTVMAYKAAARRMRQVLDIRDPLPLSAALPTEGNDGRQEAEHRMNAKVAKAPSSVSAAKGILKYKDYGADEISKAAKEASADGYGRHAICEADGRQDYGLWSGMCEADELDALRAQAVYIEVMAGIGGGHRRTAALVRRLGELTDPDSVEDVNMLEGWKAEYRNKITVRTKSKWERRLRWTG